MSTEAIAATQETWLRFVDEIEPYRKDLFRYCLKLTANPFDAEDLVHDGMLKTFSSMASHEQPLSSAWGFLLKITSNLWIDSIRRSQLGLLIETERVDAIDNDELREAVTKLIAGVNPKQQVIIILSDVFELTHKEIAQVLSTTEGAVKVALHRTRAKLRQTVLPARAPKQVVENFIRVFQTHDIDAITALLAPDFEADVFPYILGTSGRQHHAKQGWINGCLFHHIPAREASGEAYPLQIEVRGLFGEFVALVSRLSGGTHKLEEIWRFEAEDGELTSVRDYGFSPDLVGWVAGELKLQFNKVGYRLHKDSYR